MKYSVKEIYYTLQGEGALTGTPAVFCRFTGCNLWSGLEEDRETAACNFCDTDFVGTDGRGGGVFEDACALAAAVEDKWPALYSKAGRLVVCTGGEPLLQLDAEAIRALHDNGFGVAIETNGTLLPPAGVDWICVSPKSSDLILREGEELKLVFPQESLTPEHFDTLEFGHFFLQPMDGPELEKNTRLALEYCLANPLWKLSLQSHKLWRGA